jgi:1,4-dihydroxy-2-naphthoyl-CoA hydrolase
VDANTIQQLGMLSGGASAALAETTGSLAAYLSLDRKKFFCVGLDLNINHLKAATEGHIYAIAEPVHLGRKTHVWQIKSTDDSGELVSMATLTMAILELNDPMRSFIEKKLAGLF